MENSKKNEKITDSGYSNSSSDNMQSQKSKELKKKHKKISEVTEVNNPLKHLFEKQTGNEKAMGELIEITDSRENMDVFVSDDKEGLGPQINLLVYSRFPMIGDFFTVISMSDGLVVFTTPNLYKAFGYSQDDRKCFIDFICAQDRETFFDGLTNIYPAAQKELFQGRKKSKKVSLFCRLQKTGQESNELTGVEKVILSKPFYCTLYIQDLRDHMNEALLDTTFLVVMAQAVQSAYKEPEEYIKSSILFSTLHTVTCHISHVDPEVVQFMGYLPQDMIGRSLFNFYHPEDLHFIKEIYETVSIGKNLKYQTYMFPHEMIVLVPIKNTMLSAHINPWTKKLESVQGLHRVLKGPKNPDVFGDSDKSAIYNEEELEQCKLIQTEILSLLQRDILKNQHQESKNFKFLEPVILNLLNEMLPSESRMDTEMDDRSFSGSRNPLLQEYAIAMPKKISREHAREGSSNSSTEAVPSYNQLNFEANMDRFFSSNLVLTANYGNDEDSINANSGVEPQNNSKNSSDMECISPNGESDQSRSQSAGNLKNNFNNQSSSEATSSGMGTFNYLTESLISQHNEKMKNMFVQNHAEVRLNIKNNNKRNESRMITTNEKIADPIFPRAQGVKRCRNSSEKSVLEKVPKKKFHGMHTNEVILNNIENNLMKLNVNIASTIQNGTNTKTDTKTNNCQTRLVNVPDSLPTQINSKFQATPASYYNSLGIFQAQNPSFTRNKDSAILPVASENMMQQNLHHMTKPLTKIGCQQWSDVSEDISSTSSFYSSFLSKSCDGTSSSKSKRSNQEFSSEFSFYTKQPADLYFRKPTSFSSRRQWIKPVFSDPPFNVSKNRRRAEETYERSFGGCAMHSKREAHANKHDGELTSSSNWLLMNGFI
ncbi:period circadian protein-like [Belonocnema kinseyi]|uniref:period circadian protein-like n=1 Tax=Belonocnema kinseyi TaxID=2817044 RepID=UPI00143D5187|nr:period circadian protein-like [Belonocnema kinseyi]